MSSTDVLERDRPEVDEGHDATHASGAQADALLVIVESVRRIETLLQQRHGATGRGLHTKVDSVGQALPAELVKQLRWIATMRNKTLHEDGFLPEDMPRLRDVMQECEQRLAEQAPAGQPAVEQPMAKPLANAQPAKRPAPQRPVDATDADAPRAAGSARGAADASDEGASDQGDERDGAGDAGDADESAGVQARAAAPARPKQPLAGKARRLARPAAETDPDVAFRRLLLGLAVCTAIVIAIALSAAGGPA